MSDNHLKPPSKKQAKQALRSVTEEPSRTSGQDNLLEGEVKEEKKEEEKKKVKKEEVEDDLEELKLDDVKLDDDPVVLKRVSSDLLSPAGSVKAET